MSTQLIVPSRHAVGKPGRRPVPNPFANVIRTRQSHTHQKYRGRAWRPPANFDPIPITPGRRMGQTHGSYIDDLVQLRKMILLCWRCKAFFYPKSVNYYKDAVFPRSVGDCDACKRHSDQAQAFFPEERLAEPGGIVRPGQILIPA